MDYRTKKEEMMKKYERQIALLSEVHDVDMGVAFDMLKTNEVNHGHYDYINHEEFAKDYEELTKLS